MQATQELLNANNHHHLHDGLLAQSFEQTSLKSG
jgi:hypothetical protein